MLFHLCVFGEFHVSKVDEFCAYPRDCSKKEDAGDAVVDYLLCSDFHIFNGFKILRFAQDDSEELKVS